MAPEEALTVTGAKTSELIKIEQVKTAAKKFIFNFINANSHCMEQKKRVGIWVRVSTDFQVKDDSPEHHEQRARYYAEAKGWEVVTVYRLEAVSGKTVMELPEAKQMLKDINSGRITALVFSKLARLARNTKELLEFSELFRKAGADMVSLAENIDTSSPSGRLFFTIIAAMAEWERAEIADRVAASVPIRAKMGKPLGGAAPYGYRWDGKALVIDQNEAPIRKRIYELFAEHRKKGTVAKKLNEAGYRTRNGSDTTIGRLLHDTTAKGIRLANYTKSTGDGKKWVYKPESDWVQTPCPAVVTAEVWDTCNAILREQEGKNKRAVKPASQLFSGILLCECTGKMYYHPDGGKYKCVKCRKNKIHSGDIEEIYYSQLEAFLLTDTHFDGFLSKAKQEIEDKGRALHGFLKEKKRIQDDMDKKMELYMAGQIPKDRFGSHYGPLDAQLRQIESSIPQLEAEIDVLKLERLDGDTVKNEARSMYERWNTLDKTEQRSFVERVTSRIIVGSDEVSIRFRYHPSFFGNAENDQRNFIPALAFFGVDISAKRPSKGIENPQTIGEHLRNRRLELKLLQKDVAQKLEVSEDTITYWENGRSKPSIRQFPKIVEFLGYDPYSYDALTLSGRMKLYRHKNGLSQEELAKMLGVNESTVFSWEKEKHAPLPEQKKQLEEILNQKEPL